MRHSSGGLRREKADVCLDGVIPGRLEGANPESRDSPMRNCAPEVWCLRTIPDDGRVKWAMKTS